MRFYLPASFYLAADYNCSAYGAGAYNEGEACATTPTSNGSTGSAPGNNPSTSTGTSTGNNAGGSTGNSNLANTGMDLILPLALGVALIAGSLILFFKKPKNAK